MPEDFTEHERLKPPLGVGAEYIWLVINSVAVAVNVGVHLIVNATINAAGHRRSMGYASVPFVDREVVYVHHHSRNH